MADENEPISGGSTQDELRAAIHSASDLVPGGHVSGPGPESVPAFNRDVQDPYGALRLREFRFLLCSNACATLAGRALAVVIGYQIYEQTRDPMALGWLGLVEAIPAVSLALFGGHFADRHNRRRIVLTTQAIIVLCATAFAIFAFNPDHLRVPILYGIIFLAGVARGFADPALSAFEAQVVPRELTVNAGAWLSSMWQSCAIIGPALAGMMYAFAGVATTYVVIAALTALAWWFMFLIEPRRMPVAHDRLEPMLTSILMGVKYVGRSQVLCGSMALDLFAVLFGGAMALLPIFASDILKVGSTGLGFLAAAPSVGSLLVTLWATHHAPARHAGRNLLLSVAGFGVCMIIFALSEDFTLSLVALAAAGAFDGVSVVIRKAILRLMSPEHMRGRVASVSWVFISSSNELGAFESGVAAKCLGTVRSVWMGGIVTLGVVAGAALLLPELRRLDLRKHEQEVNPA